MSLRKALVIVLTVALVLGTVATFASAATPPDVKDTKYAAAVNRLNALGVLAGYPDGSFKPGNSITRAEFAKVIVAALGLTDAANIAAGPTQFSDVAADHWASGFINIAVSKGILKGYPDGTFKPEANVTYAEALTMLIRALGYEPLTVGPWPTNIITKAVELGLTAGISVKANDPATRGDVALMTDTAVVNVPLVVPVQYSDKVIYEVSNPAEYLTGALGVTTAGPALVIGTPNTGLASNQIAVSSGTLTLHDGATDNPNALLGHYIKYGTMNFSIGLSTQPQVVYINDVTNSSKLVSGTAGTIAGSTFPVTVGSATTATNYTLASGVQVVSNYRTAATSNITSGDTVALTLDDSGNVAFVSAISYDTTSEDGIVTGTVTDSSNNITGFTYEALGGSTATLSNLDTTVVVTRDGKAAGLSDIKTGDVIRATLWNSKVTSISAITTNVTGVISQVNFNSSSNVSSVVIGGTTYSVISSSTASTTYNVAGGNDMAVYGNDSTFSSAAIGQTAQVFLNADGYARLIALQPASNTIVGYVTGTDYSKANLENGAIVSRSDLQLVTSTGESKTVQFSTTLTTSVTSSTLDTYKTKVVTVNLGTDGYATAVSVHNLTQTNDIAAVDTTAKTVTLGSNIYYFGTNTYVFDASGATVAAGNIGTLAVGQNVSLEVSGLTVQTVVINKSAVMYGLATKVYSAATTSTTVYDIDVFSSKSTTYQRADSVVTTAGNLISFRLSGGQIALPSDLTDYQTGSVNGAVYDTIASVDSTTQTFTLTATAGTFAVTPSTIVIDYRNPSTTGAVAASFATLKVGQAVQLFTTSTTSPKAVTILVIRY